MEVIEHNLVLPEFEGPLDLLLHLVKKHELDIFNIPISFITAKYIQMLSVMQAMNMDLAGEYLLMAATLAYIKSRELLPADAQPEDPDLAAEELGDPREALIKRLLEFQKFKRAGHELSLRPVVGRNVWGRGARSGDIMATGDGEVLDSAPLAEVPVWELIELLAKTLGRTRRRLSHEITVDRLSLADRINELSERLDRSPRLEFVDLLREFGGSEAAASAGAPFSGHIVITFMALLEMARLRLLSIYQAEEMGSIYITRQTSPTPVPPTPSAEPVTLELPFGPPPEPAGPSENPSS